MNQTGARLEAEIYAVLGSTDVDVLDICTLREVLHISGTVENGIYPQTGVKFFGDVAKDDVQAMAKEFFERIGEVLV